MSDYQLTAAADVVKRTIDGMLIPNDPMTLECAAYNSWLAAGGIPDAYIPPLQTQIFSQDLMAQFTADDAAKIQAAVSANVQFWLLWSSLQAQKDPMEVGNARFLAGWGALVSVLGQARMDAIATALGVTVG